MELLKERRPDVFSPTPPLFYFTRLPTKLPLPPYTILWKLKDGKAETLNSEDSSSFLIRILFFPFLPSPGFPPRDLPASIAPSFTVFLPSSTRSCYHHYLSLLSSVFVLTFILVFIPYRFLHLFLSSFLFFPPSLFVFLLLIHPPTIWPSC